MGIVVDSVGGRKCGGNGGEMVVDGGECGVE